MGSFVLQYYAVLSSLANWLTTPLGNLADSLNIPIASALLFGLIGSTAPCQLSSSAATLAFLSRGAADPGKVWAQTLAYVAGKMTVYLIVGGMMVMLGLQLNQISQTAIPVIGLARRAMGPLLIVVGLFMLGLFNIQLSVGARLSTWLDKKVGRQRGILPAYLMGITFSFAFCPTLFWLFFGLTIPLAIASSGGIFLPGVFAIGTALPILGLAALMASGAINLSQFLKRFKAVDVWIQRAAGIIFILIGLNEIVLYWLI